VSEIKESLGWYCGIPVKFTEAEGGVEFIEAVGRNRKERRANWKRLRQARAAMGEK
jgi:hypothetical protein